MLESFSWQGYLDFSLFTLHFSLQQLTWYRLNYLTTENFSINDSSRSPFSDTLPPPRDAHTHKKMTPTPILSWRSYSFCCDAHFCYVFKVAKNIFKV